MKSALPRFCGCSGPADGCILQAMTTTQESQIRRWSTVEIMNMKYLTADSLKKLLTDCGFSEVTVETEADGRIFAAAGK